MPCGPMLILCHSVGGHLGFPIDTKKHCYKRGGGASNERFNNVKTLITYVVFEHKIFYISANQKVLLF